MCDSPTVSLTFMCTVKWVEGHFNLSENNLKFDFCSVILKLENTFQNMKPVDLYES